ncbi:MAG: hypothetical protein AAGF94_16645 [Pseudomonadota bacterium]
MKDSSNTGQMLSGAFNNEVEGTLDAKLEKYRHHLADSDLTLAQQDEFLRALWAIMSTFVDLGFDLGPDQETCGQNRQTPDQHTTEGVDPLNLDVGPKTDLTD